MSNDEKNQKAARQVRDAELVSIIVKTSKALIENNSAQQVSQYEQLILAAKAELKELRK